METAFPYSYFGILSAYQLTYGLWVYETNYSQNCACKSQRNYP